jgi:hypothetical protein
VRVQDAWMIPLAREDDKERWPQAGSGRFGSGGRL